MWAYVPGVAPETLDIYNHHTTDPFITCDWNNGVISPNNEEFNCTETPVSPCHVEHEYSKQGEYTITCTVENHVSSLELQKNVIKTKILLY